MIPVWLLILLFTVIGLLALIAVGLALAAYALMDVLGRNLETLEKRGPDVARRLRSLEDWRNVAEGRTTRTRPAGLPPAPNADVRAAMTEVLERRAAERDGGAA